MATLTRRDRLTDLAALALLVVGIALYADGTARLRQIMSYSYQHPGPRGIRQLDVADGARYEANAGIGIVVLGVVVGVASAVRVVQRKKRLVS